MNYRRIVPNSISGLSLVLGVLSIFKTLEGDFFWAPLLIVLAVAADSLDGRAARFLHCPSDFGIQLDSLCDLASFGVAPAIMIYKYALMDLEVYGQLLAGFYAFMGAMRLARFNVNSSVVHGYFQGMPIPAGACCLATYVLSGFVFGPIGSAVLTMVIALILYSDIRFPDCKGKGSILGPLSLTPVGAALGVGVFLLEKNPYGWPFVLMSVYTLAGIFNWVWRIVHKCEK